MDKYQISTKKNKGVGLKFWRGWYGIQGGGEKKEKMIIGVKPKVCLAHALPHRKRRFDTFQMS